MRSAANARIGTSALRGGNIKPRKENQVKEVEYSEIERWGWECPVCGQWNEEEDDPSYQETVLCQNPKCNGEFIPVPG